MARPRVYTLEESLERKRECGRECARKRAQKLKLFDSLLKEIQEENIKDTEEVKKIKLLFGLSK